MNERIKELLLQATTLRGPFIGFKVDQEKFAGLLIKECRDIVGKTRDQAIEDEWNVDEAMSTAMFNIEEHFGVEEIMEDQSDEIEYCPTCGEEWSGTSCGALRCGWIEGNEE